MDDGVPASLERNVDVCGMPNEEFPQLLGQDPQEVRFQLGFGRLRLASFDELLHGVLKARYAFFHGLQGADGLCVDLFYITA